MYYSLRNLFRYMNPSYPVNLSPTRMASTSAAISYIISQIASDDLQTSSKAVRQVSLVITMATLSVTMATLTVAMATLSVTMV